MESFKTNTIDRDTLVFWFTYSFSCSEHHSSSGFTLLCLKTTSTIWRYLSKISSTRVVEHSWLFIGEAVTKAYVFHLFTFFEPLCNHFVINFGVEKVCMALFSNLKYMLSAPWTDSLWEPAQGNHFVFCLLLSCACVPVNTFLNTRATHFRALSVLYSNKLPVSVPCWRICAGALAEPDTILLWQNGKHSQHTACLVLSDGKIKANPNKIHSLHVGVGRWRDHQRGTARSTMSSDHIIIDPSLPLSSSVCLCLPEPAQCCFHSHFSCLACASRLLSVIRTRDDLILYLSALKIHSWPFLSRAFNMISFTWL